MNKQAFLEETYNSAFNDELEKNAISTSLLSRSIASRLTKSLHKATNKNIKNEMKSISETLLNKSKNKKINIDISMKSLKDRFLNSPAISDKNMSINAAKATKNIFNKNISELQSITKGKKIGNKEINRIRLMQLAGE